MSTQSVSSHHFGHRQNDLLTVVQWLAEVLLLMLLLSLVIIVVSHPHLYNVKYELWMNSLEWYLATVTCTMDVSRLMFLGLPVYRQHSQAYALGGIFCN